MAILLPDSDCIIYEIPRTGTTWMRHTLSVLGIPWEQAPVVSGVCERHALPEHCLGDYALRVCVEREPMAWLQSYWFYHRGMTDSAWQCNVHYPHRIFGPPVEGSFDGMVERIRVTNPDSVEQYLNSFYRHCCIRLNHDSLADEFHSLLTRCGYKVSLSGVTGISARNASSKP